jgi:hypothetical protein
MTFIKAPSSSMVVCATLPSHLLKVLKFKIEQIKKAKILML